MNNNNVKELLQSYIDDIDWDIENTTKILKRAKEFDMIYGQEEIIRLDQIIKEMKSINEVLKDIVKGI